MRYEILDMRREIDHDANVLTKSRHDCFQEKLPKAYRCIILVTSHYRQEISCEQQAAGGQVLFQTPISYPMSMLFGSLQGYLCNLNQ
jgi:hypothetical protein